MMTTESTPGGRTQRYYGKYRGTVRINVDPEQIGRVMLQVPDVLGNALSNWALPCLPAAGIQSGCFIVPPVGSKVWVEFEQGDSNYPIWTGGFWGQGEVPSPALSPPPIPAGQNFVIQTTGRSMLVLSDAPPTSDSGGILLKSGDASILVNAIGIFIDNGHGATMQLVGNSVDINSGALTVT
jgi:uncharacterized protein involved in type VI secretion and phage assembly